MSDHYRTGSYETWDFCEDVGLDALEFNVVKYLTRAGRKGERKPDIDKALTYLDRLAKRATLDRVHVYTYDQDLDAKTAAAIELVVQRRYEDAARALRSEYE